MNAYRDALAKLNLSHAMAARIFGVSERTSYRWSESQAPAPIMMLLQSWLDDPKALVKARLKAGRLR